MSHELRCLVSSLPSNFLSEPGIVNGSSVELRDMISQPDGVLLPRMSLRIIHSSLEIVAVQKEVERDERQVQSKDE